MPKTKPVNYLVLKTELDEVMSKLQREDLDVDAALVYYQRGLELVKQLEAYLKSAENTLTKLQAKPGPAGK